MNEDYLLDLLIYLPFKDKYPMDDGLGFWPYVQGEENLFLVDSLTEFDCVMAYHGCLDSGLL